MSYEEVNLMFCLCDYIGKMAVSEKHDKDDCNFVLFLLIAEKANDLHGRTYTFGNLKKTTRVTFKLSEAAALRILLPLIPVPIQDQWNVNKRNEFVALFDKYLS
jgi:hypothetical protein